MKTIFLAILVVLMGAVTALAQEDDAMEVQRCIWRCLADSRGANDPAYHQCVARLCNEPVTEGPQASTPAPVPAPAPAPAGWVVAQGVSYPSMARCRDDGYCLMLSCRPGARMVLEIYAEGNGAVPGDVVRMRIDGHAFDAVLPGLNPEQVYTWDIATDFEGMLRSGTEFAVAFDRVNENRIPLAGTATILDGLRGQCR